VIERVAIGYQRWDALLFLHWPVPLDALRPLVDRRLEVEPFEGRAWVSATPFTVRGARLRGLPPIPSLSDFHEVNLRTYVRFRGGSPGVWFFSLDAASGPAAALARASLGLPYFRARIRRSERGQEHAYESVRRAPASRRASVSVDWITGAGVPSVAAPGTLEHFLVERYALYSAWAGRLLRVRVRHPPWPLVAARVERCEETLTAGAGLAPPAEAPRAQFSPGVDVEFFPPEVAA
jgi:uncharacterized protein YqjF (DUF2071 family)